MAASLESACVVGGVLEIFSSCTKNPEQFLGVQDHIATRLLGLTKELYDLQSRSSRNELSELVLDGFEEEQVWQQLELRNKPLLKETVSKVSRTATRYARPSLGIWLLDRVFREEALPSPLREESASSLEPELEVRTEEKQVARSRPPRFAVDDRFFRLSELSSFLDREDARQEEESDSEESVDYFEEPPSDDEDGKSGKNATYKDFFDPPEGEDYEGAAGIEEEEGEEESDDEEERIKDEQKGGRGHYDLQDAESPDDEASSARQEAKSSFERSREAVHRRIERLEEDILGEKPWNLLGEVDANRRPENSLLQEHIQFDHMTRQAPTITEDTTKKLEEMILQRVKDKAWDDVERKSKPTEEPFEFRRRVVLDQEKSKLSLAQVYEQQFLKQRAKEKHEEEDPAHKEIRDLMVSLFAKLDALSNFHLMPKQAAPELKVVNNLPSVTVEEVTPTGVSDAQLLAPEEIKEKPRKEVVEEKTKSRRMRERRAKVAFRKRAAALRKKAREQTDKQAKEEALHKVLKHSSAKVMKRKDNKEVSSSKKFFEKLQDQVSNKTVKPLPKKKMLSKGAVSLKL